MFPDSYRSYGMHYLLNGTDRDLLAQQRVNFLSNLRKTIISKMRPRRTQPEDNTLLPTQD